jgi:hypothetical protein
MSRDYDPLYRDPSPANEWEPDMLGMDPRFEDDEPVTREEYEKLFRDLQYDEPDHIPRIWIDGKEMTHAELSDYLDAADNATGSSWTMPLVLGLLGLGIAALGLIGFVAWTVAAILGDIYG